MIALQRRDVAILNSLARSLMDRGGKLGTERRVAGDHEFATGDRIVCLRNDDRIGVQNGTRGTVVALPSSGGITVRTDGRDHVEVPVAYMTGGPVRHAYAITGHAAQGSTVERAFVLAESSRALKEWGYVGLSRASTNTRIYVTERDLDGLEHPGGDAATRFGDSLARTSNELLARHRVLRVTTRGEPRRTPRGVMPATFANHPLSAGHALLCEPFENHFVVLKAF